MKFPTLYHKTKTGATVQWSVFTIGNLILSEYGQIGGKMMSAVKPAEGKNVGRSNETSPDDQADIEAAAMHKNRLDRKYSLTVEKAQECRMRPMLAGDFQKQKHKLAYPVYIQPKLDGFRCLAFREGDTITLVSRSGKTFNLPHIEQALLKFMPDDSILDGELYCHGVAFQTVASWIKKNRPETGNIGYHVYDVPNEDPFYLRCKELTRLAKKNKSNIIQFVETSLVFTESDVSVFERCQVENGFEGAIVRVDTGLYEFDHRSKDLLKVKQFDDAEFIVTGGKTGRGKFENMCIFECVLSNGKKFDVMPRGTESERKNYLKKLKTYIGQPLKVKYFGLSEEGVPRFPVGLGFRPGFD
jgi:hypothetical protein